MPTKAGMLLAAAAALALLTLGLAACSREATLSVEESNNRVAVTAVHVAAVGLGEALKGVADEGRRITLIRAYIDPIRFFNDQSGYFYVYDYQNVNIAHAVDKTLPGRDLTDYQDPHGKYVIRELTAAAQQGGGFVTFYWPHPQTKEVQRKVGYVEPIPGTGYYIGTGYYPDTV